MATGLVGAWLRINKQKAVKVIYDVDPVILHFFALIYY